MEETPAAAVGARPANHGIKLALAGILALTGIGSAVAAAVTEGGAGFAVAGAAIAVALWALAYLLYRAARPPALPGVEIAVHPAQTVPGGRVEVALRRTGEAGADARPVRIGLVGAAVKRTSYLMSGGAEAREVFHEDWRDVAPASREQRFAFDLPPRAPESRSDSRVRISWSVEARSPRRLAFDRRLVRPVAVERRRG